MAEEEVDFHQQVVLLLQDFTPSLPAAVGSSVFSVLEGFSFSIDAQWIYILAVFLTLM